MLAFTYVSMCRPSHLTSETAFTEPLTDDVINFQAQASSCGSINKEPTGKFSPSSNYWPSDWVCTSAERASASQRTGLCPWFQTRGGCQSDFKWGRSLCEKWWQDEQSVCRRGENSKFTETISRYPLATDVQKASARLATDALTAIPVYSMQTVAFIKIVSPIGSFSGNSNCVSLGKIIRCRALTHLPRHFLGMPP